MSDGCLRLSAGVMVEPRYGDMDVDCRMLFIGDRYRQLVRAYAEAIFRLSRDRSLAERAAYLRASADVAQFYDVIDDGEKITLHMRDAIFYEQAPLEELDLTLLAGNDTREVSIPLPLDRFKAVGALLPLLNGAFGEREVMVGLDARLDGEAARFARDVLSQWREADFVHEGPAAPNAFLQSAVRPRVTFMGHSSIMLQSRQTAVLTDPLFRARLGIPPMAFDTARLKLGAICCSHSHWDHSDVATLLHFDKSTPIVIPRVHTPTVFNPPIVPMLTRLGFTNVREIEIWDRVQIDDIEIVAVPFHGEQDEPDAEIDHYTYVLRTEGLSVYGGVDAYRDTYGEMLPALERVRQEWAPDVAFLPVSRMTYAWKHGGVNGFCRSVDTNLLDQWFQYTASAEQAVEWARRLGVRRVVPYATFNFTPYDVPPQAREFDLALKAAGLSRLLLPLRPFDAAEPDDLTDSAQAAIRREYLLTVLRTGAAAKKIDGRLKHNLGYRLVKRVLSRRSSLPAIHH
jgi:L-ascorbate metabolism protein UlaG (beta-lactamase superfamily)